MTNRLLISLSFTALSAYSADILPLKHGLYAQSQYSCADAPNMAIRYYDGLGFSNEHTHACRSKATHRTGPYYAVETSCVDAGSGDAPRLSKKESFGLKSNTAFDIFDAGAATPYRWCGPLPK